MLAPTHLVFGQASFLIVCVATGHAPAIPEAAVAAASALIPDLDNRRSHIGRLFPFLSGPLEYWFGHRTLTHALPAQMLGLALAWFSLPHGHFLALSAGWLSHTLADMMTPSGVAWFWPARARCVLPGNVRFRMPPMGWGELGFAIAAATVCFPLLGAAESGLGATGLIRQAIGNVAAAREQYDAQKGRHAWRLRIKGRDNRSHADIGGVYPVIGPWRETGFLVATESGARSLCRASGCDWYAERAELQQGAPQETRVHEIHAPVIQGRALRSVLAPLQNVGEVYLLGTVRAKGITEQPPTLTLSGERVHLHYARPAQLPERTLREVEVTVQIRHPPGRMVPELKRPAPENDALPPLLRRWVSESLAPGVIGQ